MLILAGGLIGIGFYERVIPNGAGPNVNPAPTAVTQPLAGTLVKPDDELMTLLRQTERGGLSQAQVAEFVAELPR